MAHAGREDIALYTRPQQAELVLGADEPGRRVFLGRRRGDVDLIGRKVAVTDLANLAGRDEPVERLEGLLDRHAVVGSMLLVEVDAVDPQAAQAALGGSLDPCRAGAGLALTAQRHAELRGDDHLIAPAGERPAQELL